MQVLKIPTIWRSGLLDAVASVMVVAALAAALVLAPTESTMGPAQRIVYVHVAVAWLSLANFVVVAAAGAMYLLRRNLAWDQWSQAAAELGWLAATLTLVTGSLWARAAWNVWWTWDPRLMTAFVLWAIYSAYLLLRGSVEEAYLRARLAAVLAILGLLDVPLVVMATRWFRGIHPVSPKMEPSMRLVLLATVVGFSALFALLLARRRTQLQAEAFLAADEED